MDLSKAKIAARLAETKTLALGLVPVAQSGIIAPMRPDRLARVAAAWVRWDFTPSSLLAISARRAPDRVAVIDDSGELTYGQLEADVMALARSLSRSGVGTKSRVGVLCRNHRGVLQVLGATGRVGADLVLLNTGLSGKQLGDVLTEQKITVLVADGEFAEVLPDDIDERQRSGDLRLVGAVDGLKLGSDVETVDDLIERSPADVTLPTRPRRGRTVVLTSGTTGTPKGAHRPEPRNWMPAAAVLSRIPLRSGETTVVAAPMFHTWGFAALQLSLALGSTMVLRRKFTPAECLADVERHQAKALFVVPVMLQRILELPEDQRRHDTSSLRVIAASGSALGVPLVKKALETFGPVLYNLYGSTEVSWVSIAQPQELQEHPSTAGRPPLGTEVEILDDEGKEVTGDTVGRVFVGNGMLFEGYTRAGEDKEIVRGLMSTGDLGHLGDDGLLYIDGRSDDMVVSGGENVYPGEVEDLINALDGVREVLVTGVDDEKFGARLAAYVVREGDDGSVHADSVREHVKKHLARFSVPRDVVFLDELPRNATGKIVKRELPDSQEKSEQ
ncbi:AMP-binding protein [Rhodococcus sp. X156]|uniref:AMP-binding protein n=1 Tax=Rhodococcus sp. X156 TaxID=2499145 RepID=UPI000FD79B43|nr:AMP-binding protein [Rhodococcus sp. X156]